MTKRWLTLALLLLVTGCGYNRIQELEALVAEARANIEAELMRRNDLIPNLVATVEAAAEFEQETFTEVARARSGLLRARQRAAEAVEGESEPEELARAGTAVARNLRTYLNVVVENYPTLRANRSFLALQDQLAATANRIAVARRDYNEAVRIYNTYINQIPAVFVANFIGAEPKEPYEAPASARQAPEVEFDIGAEQSP